MGQEFEAGITGWLYFGVCHEAEVKMLAVAAVII